MDKIKLEWDFDKINVPKASEKRDNVDYVMLKNIIDEINKAKINGSYSVLAVQDEYVSKRVLKKLVDAEYNLAITVSPHKKFMVEVQWPEGSNGKILAAVKDSFIENTTLDKIYEKIK